jgi:hypothetical protein
MGPRMIGGSGRQIISSACLVSKLEATLHPSLQ